MATGFQAMLAKKIQLTKEELARLNGEQIAPAVDEQFNELSVLCRMIFSIQGDESQRWFLPKELRAAVEENLSAS